MTQSNRTPNPSVHGFADSPAPARRPAPMFLGHSPPTRQVQAQIHRVVRSPAPILVSGASGTGKATVAEILHHYGVRPGLRTGARFEPIRVDENVLNRLRARPEFVYLVALEQLPLAEQAALPTLLEGRRVVLATRLDPTTTEAKQRLHPAVLSWCAAHIRLPTLTERIEDLEPLALRILAELPARRPIGGINDYALDCLRAYSWPGNVTELEQVLREAIAAGTSEQIELRDLPAALRLHAVEQLDLDAPDFDFSLAHATRTAIERAMRYARGNKRKAAKLLQIGKTTLYRRLHDYSVEDDTGSHVDS